MGAGAAREIADSDAGGVAVENAGAVAPVFLVGPARSGTSLLYKVLSLHPEAAYVSNWVARFPRARPLALLNRVVRTLPSVQLRVWFDDDSNAYVYGRRRPLRDRLVPMPVEGESLYRICGMSATGDEAAPMTDRQAARLRRAIRSILRYGGGETFINKRIANNRRIPLLARAFPSARFLAIVRDGRAVAYSLSRVDWWDESIVWWYGGTPRQWREEGRDPWEMCARNWVEELNSMEEGLRSVPGPQVLRVRYESFVADPGSTLERVAAFAGLPANMKWQASVAKLRFPNRNEAWRERLDAEAVEAIWAVQATELERHGYA